MPVIIKEERLMIKKLKQLGLSDNQVAGIRMRLINVFLDNNSNYSVESLTTKELSQRDVLIIKSGYLNEVKKVLSVVTWLSNNENQFKSFFIANERLSDYQELDFQQIIFKINLFLQKDNPVSKDFIDFKVSETYQNQSFFNETFRTSLFSCEETETSKEITEVDYFSFESKVVYAA